MDIIGVDEVGRGCWAGPLVAAAVRLTMPIKGLRDSKMLSAKQRHILDLQIRASAHVGIGWVSPQYIDTYGLTKAVKSAMMQAVLAVSLTSPIIIDGNINYLSELPDVQTIVKGDQLIPEISAASIVAKEARDRYMRHIHHLMPHYQFDKHVGYGTKLHQEMLKLFGASSLHRMSYKPVAVVGGYVN